MRAMLNRDRGSGRGERAHGGRRLRGPWRVAVTESSMHPAIEPGDWLLVDPTTARWPRRGSIVGSAAYGDGALRWCPQGAVRAHEQRSYDPLAWYADVA